MPQVRSLSNATGLLESALGWRHVHMRHANRHRRGADLGPADGAANPEAVIRAEMGEELNRHNRWDLLAYEDVRRRFEARLMGPARLRKP